MASFEPVVALSTKAKALTQYLLNQQFAKLPKYLQPYDPFLQKLFLGAAAGLGIGSSIYLYLQQLDRPKLQLAIFHVLRMLENDPNLGAILQDPERLALALEAEVIYMVPGQLTQSEGDQALKELKRKVRDEQLDLHRYVRPVVDDPRKQRTTVHVYGTDRGFIERRSPQSSSQAASTTTVQAPSTTTTMEPFRSATVTGVNKDDDSSHEMYESGEDEQQFTPYTAPTWQKYSKDRPTYEVLAYSSDEEDLSFLPDAESPQTLENHILAPSAEAARSGYGFNYDDWSDTSSSEQNSTQSEHVSSPPATTTRDFVPESQDLTLKPKKSLIDRAMESAFDPNSPENRHFPASHFDKAEACGITVHKGKAIKPRTVITRTPPTRGFLSANRDQILRGTSLSPVDEGDSMHSEQSGKTPYRVAETRKFHAEIKAQHTATLQDRGRQPVQTPEKSPGQLEIEALAQEIHEDEEALGFLVPTPSIAKQVIATARTGTLQNSQSPKSDRRRKIGDFIKKSTSPVPVESSSPLRPVETPSKKSDTLQQPRVHEDYEDDVLIPDELVEQVKAEQQQQDAAFWDSPILEFSPFDSGASATSGSHLDDTQSRSVTPEANRLSPDVVDKMQHSPKVVIVTPKKISNANVPSQVLAIAIERVGTCPSSQGLDIKLSPDRTAAMISNPAAPATPTPAKYPRDCSRKTPKALKSHKMSESAGVNKRGPGFPPKTPVRVMEEKKADSFRQSLRKTAYKGKFGR